MHLHILLPGDSTDPDLLRGSSLASARLRLAPAAKAVRALGWQVTVGARPPSNTTLLLVGKIGAANIEQTSEQWLTLIRSARAAKCQVILDYTDHHLATRSLMSPFYTQACPLADVICVPTTALAETLNNSIKQTVVTRVVPDLLEYPLVAPIRRQDMERPRGLWFGHPSNAHFLGAFLDSWGPSLVDRELILVSAPQTLDILKRYPFSRPPQVRLAFQPWSIGAVAKMATQSDYCVIPSDLNSPKKYASNNRLVTALALGLPTVATPLPSYQPYSAYYAEVGTDRASIVFETPWEEHNLIKDFQEACGSDYQEQAVTEGWQDALQLR